MKKLFIIFCLLIIEFVCFAEVRTLEYYMKNLGQTYVSYDDADINCEYYTKDEIIAWSEPMIHFKNKRYVYFGGLENEHNIDDHFEPKEITAQLLKKYKYICHEFGDSVIEYFLVSKDKVILRIWQCEPKRGR